MGTEIAKPKEDTKYKVNWKLYNEDIKRVRGRDYLWLPDYYIITGPTKG